MITVLMIEDDVELAQILTEYLAQFQIKVDTIEDPFLALSHLRLHSYDLVILDLTLPGMDGLEVCKEILEKHNLPVIISSARSDITDKVAALQMGADDYLPKPYDPRELEARIHTVLRRRQAVATEQEAASNVPKDLVLEREKQSIYFKNELLDLTQAEFGILAYLIEKSGYVISRQELIDNIAVINEESSNKSIDVMVGRIRAKMGDSAKNPQYIKAIRGVGYKLIN